MAITSITMVDAPSSAKPGDTVNVNFNIQSLWSGGSIYVGGELNFGNTPPYRSYSIPEYALLAYGAIQYFQFPSFTMPDVPILYLQLESYYWDGANWILDAGKQIQITRQDVTTPQLSGFKILDFDKV